MFLLALPCLIAGIAALPAKPVDCDKRAPTCPKLLASPPDGSYEYPHLILPISRANPDTCYPNSYFAQVTPNDIATVFNFDFEPSAKGKTCELVFLFPTQGSMETSSFTFEGPGNFVFDLSALNKPATENVTKWNHQPQSGGTGDFPHPVNMQPGNSYSLQSGPCEVGTFSLTMSSADTAFKWFQDYNPCAIGPYVLYS